MATTNSTISPDNRIDDTQPNFDAPRLIQRVDSLAYSLPMLSPSGERCYVTLVGSFAAWGETMTALVREGFDCAEPSAWKGGAT